MNFLCSAAGMAFSAAHGSPMNLDFNTIHAQSSLDWHSLGKESLLTTERKKEKRKKKKLIHEILVTIGYIVCF